jgi:hypothetical protein
MLNPVKFKIKSGVDEDKRQLLELFLRDWIDNTCDNEVNYFVSRTKLSTILNVDFDRQEDAVALMLRGVPEEFQHYLEIVN